MTIINFKCKKCKSEFDCEVGKITFPDNIDEKLIFEKNVICPKCNIITIDETELTELGQTQVSEIYSGGEPLIKGYGLYENVFEKNSYNNEGPSRKFDISIQRHMYWDDELVNPKQCPKCNAILEKEMNSFFVIVDDGKEKMPFITGFEGNFCEKYPIIILGKDELGDMIYTHIHNRNFGIHVAGIIDLNQIPEDQRNLSLNDIDPLPIVQFKNYSDKEEHENFIKDKSVFKPIKDNFIPRQTKKIRRNEPCPCGSGKKYKKCCLDKEKGI